MLFFDWDKFFGYDCVEGGVCVNVGLQYMVIGVDNFYVNVLFGQLYQFVGCNLFWQGDLVNVGLDLGFDFWVFDYVGCFQILLNVNFVFVLCGCFDQEDFSLNWFEVGI